MYAEATFDRADMSDNSSDAHKTTRPSEIRKSETDVLKLVTAFKQFLNPFNIDDHNKDKLFSLSSGKPASEKVQENLLNYVDTGERAAEFFIQKRLVEKTIKFQDPMKKLNLHTFNSMAVVKSLSSSKKKTIQIKAERNLLGRLLLLSQENDISLEKLFKYPLSPIPWSLATADGGLVKTDKSKLMHHLESLVPAAVSPTLENCTYIIDGNALFQSLVHLPETFEDLAFQIFASLPKSEIVHFVTDTYKPDSIKGLERTRRGSATTYNIAGGAKIKLPRDFKSFLLNSENKKQLIHLVLMQWHTTRYASLLHHRKVFYAAEESCTCLTSEDGSFVVSSPVQDLFTSQEEADTRIALHCLYAARTSSADMNIAIRSPDTDVLLILVSYCDKVANQLYFDTGVGNNRRILPINSIAAAIGPEVSKALLGFHASCDCTSAFVQRGKLKPFKLMVKNANFVQLFQRIGSTTTVDNTMDDDIQHFVCCMYGKPTFRKTDKVRYEMFKSRSEAKSSKQTFNITDGMDMSLIPPCSGSLHMHALRANYQSFIWRNSHVPYLDIPSPTECGWKTDDNGTVAVDWLNGDVMPQKLIDVLANRESHHTEEISIEDFEVVSTDENEIELFEGSSYWDEVEIDNILDVIFEEDQDD